MSTSHELRERDRDNVLLSPLLRALESHHGEDGVQTVTEYYFEEAFGISRFDHNKFIEAINGFAERHYLISSRDTTLGRFQLIKGKR